MLHDFCLLGHFVFLDKRCWFFYLRDCVRLREINKVDMFKVCVCAGLCAVLVGHMKVSGDVPT